MTFGGKGQGQKVKQSVHSFTVLYLLRMNIERTDLHPDRIPSLLEVIGKLDKSGWLHSSALGALVTSLTSSATPFWHLSGAQATF